jgi:hypothetical protein
VAGAWLTTRAPHGRDSPASPVETPTDRLSCLVLRPSQLSILGLEHLYNVSSGTTPRILNAEKKTLDTPAYMMHDGTLLRF